MVECGSHPQERAPQSWLWASVFTGPLAACAALQVQMGDAEICVVQEESDASRLDLLIWG